MKKRVFAILAASLIVLSLAVPVFATSSAPETYVDMGSTLESVTSLFGDFSLANVFKIIGAMLGATLALILGWWVFRWLYGKIKSAFKGGKG